MTRTTRTSTRTALTSIGNLDSHTPSKNTNNNKLITKDEDKSYTSPSSPPILADEQEEHTPKDSEDLNENSVPVLGFTHNLLSRIQTSRSLLDRYITEQRDKADRAVRCQADVHEDKSEEIRSQLQSLREIQRKRGKMRESSCDNGENDKEEDGCNDNGGLAQQRAELEEKIAEIERDLANCHLEHKRVDKNVKVVQEIEEHENIRAEEVRKKKERIESTQKVTVDDLTLAVLKYQMLGVNFVKGDDLRLRCDFTQIDESYPEDVFSFVLNVNDDDEYEVEECQPMLNASDVDGLVYDLNDDGLWSHFIVGMREAFKCSL